MDSFKSGLIKVFINHEGELRSGWRAAAFLICLGILDLLIGGMVSLSGVFFPSVRSVIGPPGTNETPERELLRRGVQSAVGLCSAIMATIICANTLEHRTFGSIGFKLHHGWRGLLVVGSALGAGTLTLTVA